MDLTFQVPMQYCSLQHRTLLPSPVTSTPERCFCFGPATSFFLELLVIALYSSLVAYWTPSVLGTHLPVSYLFAFSYFFAFSCILEARILEWFAIPSSSGPHFVRTLHYEQLVLYSNLLFLLYWRAYIYRQTLATIKTWTVF